MVLMEALKIKLSKLLRLGKRVRILATTYREYNTELQKKYVEKYLVNMKNVEVMDLGKLCNDLNIVHEYIWRPRETVNQVIRSLSDSSDQDVTTLLLMDEVLPSYGNTPDVIWRDLEVRENVVWLLALSPNTLFSSSTQVLPQENSSILTRQLVHKHRNCPQIRNVKTIRISIQYLNILYFDSGLINKVRTFYKYFISHRTDTYLSMANDQELRDDQLPPGQAPVWIEPPEGVTQVEMLERVEEIIGLEYTEVMVLYRGSDDELAGAWCKERGWQYHRAWNITGCEAKCVVILECPLSPELITRGINKLIIINR